MRRLLFALLLLPALALADGSTRKIGVVEEYAITSFPLFGALVTPSDTVALATPGTVRADAAGAVTVVCVGNAITDEITLNLVAGEFAPCLVSYVFDTGTDAITLHVFY